MSKLPFTNFLGIVLLRIAVLVTAFEWLVETFDTTHRTRWIDWPAESDTVEATFDDLSVARFEGYVIGVALPPSVVPPANSTSGIVIEAWNAENGLPLEVRTSVLDPTKPLLGSHYCGPGVWCRTSIDAIAKRVRVRARTTEATPADWRSHTGLAIRRTGAFTASQDRRFRRELICVIGGSATVLVLLVSVLAESMTKGLRRPKAP